MNPNVRNVKFCARISKAERELLTALAEYRKVSMTELLCRLMAQELERIEKGAAQDVR